MTNLRTLPNQSRVSDNTALRPTVLVTGGSRGIGRAICKEFARAGWRVAIHFRERQAEAELTAVQVAKCGGEGFAIQADIRNARTVEAMVQNILNRWNHLDVLICNAGQVSSKLLLKLEPSEWDDVIATNLSGTFHCLRVAGSHFLSRGNGSVVVVASFAGMQGRAGQAAYAASKAGLLGLVKAAAREWGERNVTINAVLPGWQRTEMSGPTWPSFDDLQDHALRRTPALEEVVRSVYHLALRKDISGQVWNLDSRILY